MINGANKVRIECTVRLAASKTTGSLLVKGVKFSGVV
jgi:hypothetical protein